MIGVCKIEIGNIEPYLSSFDVTLIPDTITYGENSIIIIRALDQYGNVYNPSEELKVNLTVNNPDYGQFMLPDGILCDSLNHIDYQLVLNGSIKYISNGEYPHEPQRIVVTVSKSDDVSKRGDGKVVVKPSLDHFAVTIVPDTIAHTDTATIMVQAKDKYNRDITIPGSTLLDFSLDAIGEKYGSLLSPDSLQAKTLVGIGYGDAKVGKVRYIADGVNPIGCVPQEVVITISKSDDASKRGSDSVFVKCKIDYVRFAQGDPRWGDDDYDTYIDTVINSDTTYYKIRRKGCALTCMAMVLKAAGVDTDPYRLNRWMVENDGFWGPAVIWRSVNNYPNNDKVEYIGRFGRGLPDTVTLSFSEINPYLRKCYFIIAQVKNPDTQNNHWIILAGKENREYSIVDPGEHRTTLVAYENKVYRVIIYKKKNGCINHN